MAEHENLSIDENDFKKLKQKDMLLVIFKNTAKNQINDEQIKKEMRSLRVWQRIQIAVVGSICIAVGVIADVLIRHIGG